MTAKIIPFNAYSLLPDAAAKQMRLPVDSDGLREVIAARYAAMTDAVRESGAPAPEKIQMLADGYQALQRILDGMADFGKTFFRRGRIPGAVACAILAELTGDDDSCRWQHKDAVKGFALQHCLGMIDWRRKNGGGNFRDENHPDWRSLLFIRGYLLTFELMGDIQNLGMGVTERLNPRQFDSYRAATEITWPKSELSVHNAKLASRLRGLCGGPRPALVAGGV